MQKERINWGDHSAKTLATTKSVKILRTFGNKSDLIFHRLSVTGFIRHFNYFSLLLIVLLCGVGCSTIKSHDRQFASIYSDYRQGDFDAAAEKTESRSFQKKLKSNDRLLWAMEAGKLHHAAGDFEESNRYFETAEAIIQDFEERAVFSLRAGAARAAAFVTNPGALPYGGTWSDKILINTYKALNYLALGDLEGARVEVRRAYERQQEAIEQNQKAIEEARADHGSYRGIVDQSEFEKAAPVDPAVAQAYADFSNPFTTLVSGIVALADRDPARAEVDFNLLASLPSANSFVKKEQQQIENYLSGKDPAALDRPRVFVIFENGLGPTREEMRVDLVLPDLGYTGFAFPELVFQPTNVGGIKIATSAQPATISEPVASIDQIVATEFRARLPIMVLETISAIIAKEVAAKQLTDEWDGIGLLIGSLYKLAVNRADTRIWKTLDKEFQFAVFDYPPDRIARFSLVGKSKNELTTSYEVPLPDADFVLVLARSVNQHDLRITTQALR